MSRRPEKRRRQPRRRRQRLRRWWLSRRLLPWHVRAHLTSFCWCGQPRWSRGRWRRRRCRVVRPSPPAIHHAIPPSSGPSREHLRRPRMRPTTRAATRPATRRLEAATGCLGGSRCGYRWPEPSQDADERQQQCRSRRLRPTPASLRAPLQQPQHKDYSPWQTSLLRHPLFIVRGQLQPRLSWPIRGSGHS